MNMKSMIGALLTLVVTNAAATQLESEKQWASHIQGSAIVPLSAKQALVASEEQGLLLVGEHGKAVTGALSNAEGVSVSSPVAINGSEQYLVATIDGEAGQATLLSLNRQTDTLSEILRIPELSPQAVCVGEIRHGHLSIFIADEQHRITEYVVYDAANQRLVSHATRQMVGVPEASACAVDTASQSLYVVEELVGVWRYPLDMEAEMKREPVVMSSPFGPLQGEIKGIAVDDAGGLWISTPEMAKVHYYHQGQHNAQTLAGMKPESVSPYHDGEGLWLAIYDESDDRYLSVPSDLSIGERTQTAAKSIAQVRPSRETTPVAKHGDAADDPAIWVNHADPTKSLILGTDKQRGLEVYDLNGQRRQFLPVGRINNVSVLDVNKEQRPLVVGSNRTDNSISVMSIAESGELSLVGAIPTSLTEVYGLCTYQSDSGDYVFINDTDGRYQQYRLGDSPDAAELVREFSVPSQPEGCVADAKTQTLYYGEEARGVWKRSAEPVDDEPVLIAEVAKELTADVEGISLYDGDEERYLVVSSQGSNSYVVYEISEGYPMALHFEVIMDLDAGIDGVSETDGLAVTSSALPGYPSGLLVVQDGRNHMPSDTQNFKYIDWRQIQALLK